MNRLLPLMIIFTLGVGACNKFQAPAPVTLYGSTQGEGSAGVHTVVGAETLWDVAQRYQLAMRDVAAANSLSEPFDLKPGQRLRLPPPREYRAREGDSLYTVSRLFVVDTSEIARLNRIAPPYKLKAGQVIRLPTLTRETVPVQTAATAPLPTRTVPPQPNAPYINPAPVKREALPAPAVVPPTKITIAKAPEAPVKKTPITAQVPKRSSSRFLSPVEGKILSNYGPKKDGLHNDGINIAAPAGTPVRAAENGVVVYAGNELKASGNLVIIRHQDRWMTAYAHMDNLQIKRGQTVKRGQTIGTVGSSGSVDRPQLHFEVRRGTEALNPKLYLES
ncbi:MAG: LysM peptidoglycan-binding domain-containing M23 family metallopeptidase [Alphaproteobacteria bacterium]|jgi:murein DD-endopeptidase MepM/ murein hydrolase activator NlpD|nr:LysM peptidoglycan-binding domain-containing M23 family metallopeptidase [Alphaproteobacteria bacterium]